MISSERRLRAPILFALVLALGLSKAATATAQAQDEALARTLFNEGRKLAEAGQYPAACLKFEAARRAYVSAGVLMNLGDCYEKTGRTASAWTTFDEAASVAGRSSREGDALEAQRRRDALQGKLTRLSIHVSRDVPGLIVKKDSVELVHAAWDVPIPIDPGPHEVSAEAPQRQTWKRTLDVVAGTPTVELTVPELLALPEAPLGPTNPPSNEPPSSSAQPLIGLLVGGVGIATVSAGGIIGLVAKAQDNAASTELGQARHTDSQNAFNLGNVGTAVAIVGGVAAATGLTIWLTAPRGHVQVGTNGQGLLLQGAF